MKVLIVGFVLLLSLASWASEDEVIEVLGADPQASLKGATNNARAVCSARQKQKKAKTSHLDIMSAERDGNTMKVSAVCFITY